MVGPLVGHFSACQMAVLMFTIPCSCFMCPAWVGANSRGCLGAPNEGALTLVMSLSNDKNLVSFMQGKTVRGSGGTVTPVR